MKLVSIDTDNRPDKNIKVVIIAVFHSFKRHVKIKMFLKYPNQASRNTKA